jgi:copper chaperone
MNFVVRIILRSTLSGFTMERQTITVEDMNCTGCEQTVTKALTNIEGVRRADADHETDEVEVVVSDDTDEETLATAIYDAGFDLPA